MNQPDMTLHTPTEGDGYYRPRSLQWVDLCPHMGAPEKTLLHVLTSLTTEESATRRIAPEELRRMIYAGPVDVGATPKTISASGLLRLLRSLAKLGQITDPYGAELKFSSKSAAQLRGVSMAVWRHPRHDCGCPRNAFDALAGVRGDAPRFPAAGAPVQQSAPKGQQQEGAGQLSDPLGYEVNPLGQKVDPDFGGDLQKHDPPYTSPLTSPSPPPPPPSSEVQDARANRGRDGGGDEGEDDGGRGCAAPPDTPDALAADAPDGTGEGQHPADGAESLLNDAVSRWPSKHRAPRGKTRQRLTQRVSAELGSGGDPDTILDELTRDLADAKDAVAVTLSRTAEPGWGRSCDPRPDRTRTGPRPPWCGDCDETTRLVYVLTPGAGPGDGRMRRCPSCHPAADPAPKAADTGAPGADAEPAELDPDTLEAMHASLDAAPAQRNRPGPAATAAVADVRALLESLRSGTA